MTVNLYQVIIMDLISFSSMPLAVRNDRGLFKLCHNEIRDCIGDLVSQVWSQVIKEPIVNEGTVASCDPGLRLDLGIKGVWQPQVEALFDVHVIDTDAPSHCHRAPNAILESSSQEKKRMYRRQKTEAPSPHLFYQWMDCFIKRLVAS